MPATYWNAWGVFAMAFVPIAIAVAALIYTGMSHSPPFAQIGY